MKAIMTGIKHIIFGLHNIPKILFGSQSLVDNEIRAAIEGGELKYPKTVDEDLCLGCGVCANVCPTKCITMRELDKPIEIRPGQTKSKYPQIDISKCCFCYLCHDSCPTFTVHKTHAAINPRNVKCTGKKAKDLFEDIESEGDIVTVDDALCLGCGVCAKVCPVKCISMEPAKKKQKLPNGQIKEKVPRIDLKKCVKCMMCKNSCLTKKVHKKPAAIDPEGLEPCGMDASDIFEGKK